MLKTFNSSVCIKYTKNVSRTFYFFKNRKLDLQCNVTVVKKLFFNLIY